MTNLEKLQNESLNDYKWRILLDKTKGELDISWKEIDSLLNLGLASDTIRKGTIFLPEFHDYMYNKYTKNTQETYNYKQTTELLNDGSQRSDKVIAMSDEQSKDSNFLLKSHGFNENEWEVVSAKNSIWNANTKADGIVTLYSSKITVKPKVNGFNVEKFIEKFSEKVKPTYIQQPTETTDKLLTLPFVDLHMGINTLADYQGKLDETLEIIQSKNWDTIYIPIGNDGLHVNNHKNTTANGTPIEHIDLDKASDEFYEFYTIILNNALEKSKNVVVDYVQGNHDADLTWMLIKMLAKQYPQVKWDTSMEVKKFFKWKNVLLINLHGDKSLQRVSKTLLTEYRDLVVGAKCVEIYSGHLHHERVIDEFGIVKRSLPSSCKVDQWHKDMAFEGSVKISQLFEYDEDKLKTIYHV